MSHLLQDLRHSVRLLRRSPGFTAVRRAAAYQAYYETMPLRASALPSGSHMRLYRRLQFGNLIDLSVLDTRQWRSDQP
jgi:alkaline phosphatase D